VSQAQAELTAFGRSAIERRALLWFAFALTGLGFLPQLGGPGYDFALAAGAVLPSSVAIAAALLASRRAAAPLAALVRGAELGLAAAAILFVVAGLHGLRVGFCDAKEGYALLALGPAAGAVLAGVWGAAVGCVLQLHYRGKRRGLAAIWLAAAAPLSGILLSLLRFYTSPMVFAYDPFFGYFSGPLYDTVTGSLLPLVTYRLGTLSTLIASFALASLFHSSDAGGVGFEARRAGGAPRWLLFGLSTAASLAIAWNGAALGHFSTASSIEAALGRRLAVARCDVVYSSNVPEADARRVGAECQAHLGQIEHFFETAAPPRVTVWLFANDAEKGRLMGAQHTYIAKPWRSEVYIQATGYPHPVLGHELAHVVSRSFGAGPFRVAGSLYGLIPDPGRIEGVATAASPDENDALTLEEWAAAMQRLNLLPKLSQLFQLGFFGHNASRAYTAAGAFVRFLREKSGAAAVRDWYAGAPLEQVTGTSLAEFEQRWLTHLQRIPLSDAVLRTARARFERPSFFQRRCPRIIDRSVGEANARLAAADLRGAREGFDHVLSMDPHDSAARLGLANCAARSGHLTRAEQRYLELQRAGDLAPWARLLAREAQADVALRQGRLEAARELYAALARDLVDEDRLRTLDVKRSADEGIARDAVLALLVGEEFGPSFEIAAGKLGEWSARDANSGLADYLLAKNLYNRARFKDAALYLDRALERSLPEPRVRDEALRLRLVLGCATLDRVAARSAFQTLAERPLSTARREGVRRFAERCNL